MVLSQDDLKKSAAEEALTLVSDGMILGLGTGSTVKFFLHGLSRMVSGGLKIKGVPTSVETARLGRELGIEIDESYEGVIDLDVDGADEADSRGHLIKGAGGALLREKIVAYNSRKVCIIVDQSKFKEKIGESAVPVEIFQYLHATTKNNIEKLGGKCTYRRNGDFVTDNGNLILDCHFGPIGDPEKLEQSIRNIPGVAEVGLFNSLCHILVIAASEGIKKLEIGQV